MKKDISKIVIPVLSLILLIILLLSSFLPKIDNLELYQELHSNTNVLDYFNEETIDQKSEELILFFEDKKELDTNFYTSEEISHLNDVKRIFNVLKIFYWILIILFLGGMYYLYKQKNFIHSFTCICMTELILAFSLFILLYIMPFDILFELMHRILFPQGNYSFDISTSNMIRLFPTEFFTGFFNRIIFSFIFYQLLMIFAWIPSMLLKRYKITFK